MFYITIYRIKSPLWHTYFIHYFFASSLPIHSSCVSLRVLALSCPLWVRHALQTHSLSSPIGLCRQRIFFSPHSSHCVFRFIASPSSLALSWAFWCISSAWKSASSSDSVSSPVICLSRSCCFILINQVCKSHKDIRPGERMMTAKKTPLQNIVSLHEAESLDT